MRVYHPPCVPANVRLTRVNIIKLVGFVDIRPTGERAQGAVNVQGYDS